MLNIFLFISFEVALLVVFVCLCCFVQVKKRLTPRRGDGRQKCRPKLSLEEQKFVFQSV